MAKSVLGKKRVFKVSDTLEIIEYEYVYIKGVDANRERKQPSERRRGWTCVAHEREDTKNNGGELFLDRYVFQKNNHK